MTNPTKKFSISDIISQNKTERLWGGRVQPAVKAALEMICANMGISQAEWIEYHVAMDTPKFAPGSLLAAAIEKFVKEKADAMQAEMEAAGTDAGASDQDAPEFEAVPDTPEKRGLIEYATDDAVYNPRMVIDAIQAVVESTGESFAQWLEACALESAVKLGVDCELVTASKGNADNE